MAVVLYKVDPVGKCNGTVGQLHAVHNTVRDYLRLVRWSNTRSTRCLMRREDSAFSCTLMRDLSLHTITHCVTIA
jgi:hypothetical protein